MDQPYWPRLAARLRRIQLRVRARLILLRALIRLVLQADLGMIANPSVIDLLRSVQNRISWKGRNVVARAIAQTMNAHFPGIGFGAADMELTRPLREKGMCRAPLTLERAACERVAAHFGNTPCYSAHVPAYSDGIERSVEDAGNRGNYGSYRLEQNLTAPHVLESVLDPQILKLAGHYLGCIPSLYSINTFWTFPAAEAGLSHYFHRDEDDFRFVVAFTYWTDVDVGEGEFYLIEGTHDHRFVDARVRGKGPKGAEAFRRLNGGNGYQNDALYRELFTRDIACVEGRAGTVILADTFALHRGALPRSRRRLCTWARFGLYANEAYRIDHTATAPASLVRGRIPDDALTRHTTRLLLDWTR